MLQSRFQGNRNFVFILAIRRWLILAVFYYADNVLGIICIFLTFAIQRFVFSTYVAVLKSCLIVCNEGEETKDVLAAMLAIYNLLTIKTAFTL